MEFNKEAISLFVQTLKNHMEDYKIPGSDRLFSHFDLNFLQKYPAEYLSTLPVQDWLALYKERQQAILGTPFCWTLNFTYCINQVWLELAEHIASSLQASDIIPVIFPGLIVDAARRDKYKNPMGKTGYVFDVLYYQDGDTRLFHGENILKRSKLFAYYENEKYYPVSPYVFKQIVYKKGKDRIIQVLQRMTPAPSTIVDFDELLYPLFGMVKKYFEEFSKRINSAANLKALQDHINALYKDELVHLDIDSVNSFYVQIVNLGKKNQCMLLEVLLNCFFYEEFNHALQNMSDLAQWLCEKNPAMIIPREFRPEDLDRRYQILQRGEYYQLSSLDVEFSKLQKYPTMSQIVAKIIQLLPKKNEELSTGLYPEICALYKSHYRHHEINDINQILIIIWRHLSGSGFLAHHGLPDSTCLLFDQTIGGYDPVSGEKWSNFPISHILKSARENEPAHLIVVENCLNNYRATGFFENAHTIPPRCFMNSEYENTQKIPKCRGLPQYADEYPRPVLKASILKTLYNLVNLALHCSALKDNHYKIQWVKDHNFDNKYYEPYIIYVKKESSADEVRLTYRVKEIWGNELPHIDNVSYHSVPYMRSSTNKPGNTIYCDTLSLKTADYQILNIHEDFLLDRILKHTVAKEHTIPNYANVADYDKACYCFRRFRDFFKNLDPQDSSAINPTKMRFGNSVQSFAEIWSDGNPLCMAIACRYFAILYVSYYPDDKFTPAIERESADHGDFLNAERKSAKRRSQPAVIDHSSPECLADSLLPPVNDGDNSDYTGSEIISTSPPSVSSIWTQWMPNFSSKKTDRSRTGKFSSSSTRPSI